MNEALKEQGLEIEGEGEWDNDFRNDEEFIEQATEALIGLGLTEDEAERELEDYLN